MESAKRILLMLAILAFPAAGLQAQALFGTGYAVVIGIDQYANPAFPSLRYAAGDAQAMAGVLYAQGFHVFPLYNQQATRQAIMETLEDRVARQLQPDDRVVVFFAGHGSTATFAGKDKGYIVPYDASNSTATFISEEQLIEESRNMDAAKHQLWLMDSCFGGGLLDTRGVSLSGALANNISEFARRNARQALMAGGKDQEVLDGGPDGHSPFTSALLSGLQQGLADTNGDGFITFTELANWVSSNAYNSRQTPAAGTLPRHQGGEFLFVNPRGAARPVAPLPPVSAETRNAAVISPPPPSAPVMNMKKKKKSVSPGGIPGSGVQILNIGDQIPGTAWQYQGFGIEEGGAGSTQWVSAMSIPAQFGFNSRYLNWVFTVSAPPNSPATVNFGCTYLNTGGVIVGQMNTTLSLTADQQGQFHFSQGWGSAQGYTWAPGAYSIRCAANGIMVVNASFRVAEQAIFQLSRRGRSNIPLMIVTEGDHGHPRDFNGELWAAAAGVEWRDQKGDNFQAACADTYITAGKDNRVTIRHGGRNTDFDTPDAQWVVNGVNRACGR